MLKISYEAIFYGPNLYAKEPVFVARLSSLRRGSAETRDACRALRELYPEWLADAPRGETPLEELAICAARWALSALNEVRGCLWSAGARAAEQGVLLWVAFHVPAISRTALEGALQAIEHLMRTPDARREPIDALLQSLWKECLQQHPDKQVSILMEAAEILDIPVMPLIPNLRYWQFGWGERSRVFFESASNADGMLGYQMSRIKPVSKMVFSALGAPTPEHVVVNHPGELQKAAGTIGFPCVTKPVNAGKGRGITVGISSLEELKAGFAQAKDGESGPVMVEAFVPGQDYRLTLVAGRLVAAMKREASVVNGDGLRSIGDLIGQINSGRGENLKKSGYLTPVPVDHILDEHLARQGVSLQTVLPEGVSVTLRGNANLSTGGVGSNIDGDVHPHVRAMAEQITRTMGLAAAGLDYLSPDISRSWQEVGGAFIEINTTPGLYAAFTSGLSSLQVARAVMGDKPGRIPCFLVVAPGPCLAVLNQWLAEQNPAEHLGWACGENAGIGSLPLSIMPGHPWSVVQTLLRHSGVKALLLMCDARLLELVGAPVDRADRIWLLDDPGEAYGSHTLDNRWLPVLEGLSPVPLDRVRLEELKATLAAEVIGGYGGSSCRTEGRAEDKNGV